MKAGLLFGQSGPILIVITYPAFDDPGLVQELKNKGIDKYLAFEVPVDLCRNMYGVRFTYATEKLRERNDLEVLDYNSPRVFRSFKWEEMTGPVMVYSGL